MQTLQADGISDYTLDKEGLEVKEQADGIQIKVDIAKKIPLFDFSNTYIEVSDLDKALIAGDGFLQKSKGNLVFHKSGYGNEAVVFIGEKGKLTQNTYQSILSTLQVMFDTETVMHYFKQNYPNIALGNKEFSGFKIEINPEKSSMEQTVLGADNTYSFIRITINKELAITNKPFEVFVPKIFSKIELLKISLSIKTMHFSIQDYLQNFTSQYTHTMIKMDYNSLPLMNWGI